MDARGRGRPGKREPLEGCLFGRDVAQDRPLRAGIEHIGLENQGTVFVP